MSGARGAFSIGFRDLELWGVGSFVQSGWHWPAAVIKPLATALLRKQIVINPVSDPADAPQLLTIHFDGSIEPRGASSFEEFKGRLYLAEAGNVVYSKIDVRNGAIGLVPAGMPRCAVSSEYPVYQVRSDIAFGEYIQLVFRTNHFRQVINGMISGASGRKRVQPEQIELMEIPLPPLDTQSAIVARWQAAQAEADAAEAQARQVETEIDRRFFADLCIEVRSSVDRPKMLAVRWKQANKWGVRQMTDALLGLGDLPSGNHPLIPLGDVSIVSYGVQKSPANRPGEHARPYLRVANVRKGYLDLEEIKEINVLDSEMTAYRLESGDILFVEGNGSRAELGRVAIWSGEIPDCVHQNHLIKVRIDQTRLMPEFAMHWFNTEVGRGHFFRSAKTSSGLGTINSQEVRAAPIPLPPLDIQRTIVAHVQAGRAEVARLRSEVEQIRRAARAEIEALILGTQPVLTENRSH